MSFVSAFFRCLYIALIWMLLGSSPFFMAFTHAGEIDIQADTIRFDNHTRHYIAEGQAVIIRDGRTLLADRIEYNQQSGWISAIGNVQLQLPEGDTLFADTITINDSLRQENIVDFRARSKNNIRIAAHSVHTKDDVRVFDHFVYSPCHTCQQNPDRPPIWQLKAKTAEHDLKNRDYVLRKAVIEVVGWPVVYLPYFRYPDTSVKRRSGFLVPDVGTSSHLGGYVSTPYFIDLGLDKNLTVTPLLTTKAGGAMLIDYAQSLDNGAIDIQASAGYFTLTKETSSQAVGHFNGTAHFTAAKGIRYGGEARLISNLGYISALPGDHLNYSSAYSSSVYVQQLPPDQPRNLYRAEIVNYQDEREVAGLAKAPSAVPTLQASVYLPNDRWGGRIKLSGLARHIQQSSMAESQNLAVVGEYRLRHVLPTGMIADYQAKLDADYFHYSTPQTSSLNSGSRVRILPKLSVKYSFPLQRSFNDGGYGIIEPLVKLATSPSTISYDDIPNQDSGGLYDPENLLFADESTTGRSTRDDGTKLTLAVDYDHHWANGNRTSILVGKAFILRNHSSTTQLQNRPKDYVVRLRTNWRDLASIENLTTLDHSTIGEINSNHLQIDFDPLWYDLAPQLSYLYQRADADRKISRLHQGTISVQRQWGEYWQLRGELSIDFEENSALRNGLLALDYEDEGLSLEVFLRHQQITSQFREPENTLGFNINLKFGGQDYDNKASLS